MDRSKLISGTALALVITGDVEFAAASHVRLITPVPGGVGPMTLAVLLEQTVDAAFDSLVQPVSVS